MAKLNSLIAVKVSAPAKWPHFEKQNKICILLLSHFKLLRVFLCAIKHAEMLRAAVCKYREFAVKTEILKFFIFNQKKPFGEFRKSQSKFPKNFLFRENRQKVRCCPTPYSQSLVQNLWIIKFLRNFTSTSKKIYFKIALTVKNFFHWFS